MKKFKKICDEIMQRFGDGEYLAYICNGQDPYPLKDCYFTPEVGRKSFGRKKRLMLMSMT